MIHTQTPSPARHSAILLFVLGEADAFTPQTGARPVSDMIG